MNRRSFLSSLAALSLPAVVAGKVAEIAGYSCDCELPIAPTSYTVTITGTDGTEFCAYEEAQAEFMQSCVVPARRITIKQACEEYWLPLAHFRPCTVTPIG